MLYIAHFVQERAFSRVRAVSRLARVLVSVSVPSTIAEVVCFVQFTCQAKLCPRTVESLPTKKVCHMDISR